MWESGLLHFRFRSRTGRSPGKGERAAAAAGRGLDVRAVPAAISRLARLARSWPERDVTEIVWRSPEIRGGREDLRETDRSGARLAGIRRPGRSPIPDRIARRRGTTAPWSSRRLATACVAFDRALRKTGDIEVGARPLALVDQVARRAAWQAHGPDGSISSWPHEVEAAYRAVLKALVALAAAGAGHDRVPLSPRMAPIRGLGGRQDARGARRRVRTGGAPKKRHGGRENGRQRLARVSASTRRQRRDANFLIARGGPGFASVSSDLRPDGLIGLRSPEGAQALVCVDAKQRTSLTAMDPAAVAEAASKYLWGIRHADDMDRFGTVTTLIASSAPVPEMYDPDRSRTDASFLLPSGGDGTFSGKLLGALGRALKALDAD